MKKIKIFTLLCIFSWSCDQNKNDKPSSSTVEEKEDGGPCSYNYTYEPLLLLSIDSSDREDCDLTTLRIHTSDTLFYSSTNNPLAITSIQDSHLKIGDTICLEIMEINEGSCNPYMEIIQPVKFLERLKELESNN